MKRSALIPMPRAGMSRLRSKSPGLDRAQIMATARLFRVILPVSNIEEAAVYYSAVLEQPGMRVSPGRHYFGCGGVILACFDPRADGDAWDAKPHPEHVYFSVADLEGTLRS